MNKKRLAMIYARSENYVPASFFEEDGRVIQQFRDDIDDLVMVGGNLPGGSKSRRSGVLRQGRTGTYAIIVR